MPAQRPAWRGQLRLSLVSIPVELYPAQKDERTHFRQIHQPSGQPISYEKVVTGLGAVDPDQIRKGFEYEKGEFVLFRDDELDAVRLETRRTLDLSQFVDLDEISPVYFEKAYFVVPEDKLAEDAFRVIRDALRLGGKAGLGQVTMRGHEYLVAVQASGNGMVLHTLRYQDEVRQPETVFGGVSEDPANEELVAIAKQIIERSSAPFDPKAFEDRYQVALKTMIRQRLKDKAPRATLRQEPEQKEPAASTNVIELMASLKKSLEAGAPPAPASTTAARKASAARKAKDATAPARARLKKAG